MYLDEGGYKASFNYLGTSRVCNLCSGSLFEKSSDWTQQWTGYVAEKKNGLVNTLQYSASAGSESCAKAKAVVAFATVNSLYLCEQKVEARNG